MKQKKFTVLQCPKVLITNFSNTEIGSSITVMNISHLRWAIEKIIFKHDGLKMQHAVSVLLLVYFLDVLYNIGFPVFVSYIKII